MSNISRFIGNERGDKICHEDDGCPTELAVLKRFWREQQASTLPEEVANLVELLDEEEVPYEDSLGVALSLTGRTKQYANGKTATLREQVEKLTKELDNVKQVEFPRRVQKVTDALKRKHEKELAALAEQNEKLREDAESTIEFVCALEDRLLDLCGELPSQELMHKLSSLRQRVTDRKWELLHKIPAMQEDKP